MITHTEDPNLKWSDEFGGEWHLEIGSVPLYVRPDNVFHVVALRSSQGLVRAFYYDGTFSKQSFSYMGLERIKNMAVKAFKYHLSKDGIELPVI